jgi:hypothetical protein
MHEFWLIWRYHLFNSFTSNDEPISLIIYWGGHFFGNRHSIFCDPISGCEIQWKSMFPREPRWLTYRENVKGKTVRGHTDECSGGFTEPWAELTRSNWTGLTTTAPVWGLSLTHPHSTHSFNKPFVGVQLAAFAESKQCCTALCSLSFCYRLTNTLLAVSHVCYAFYIWRKDSVGGSTVILVWLRGAQK